MHILGQAFLSKLSFNYFDLFVVLWLGLGVYIGRKRGMSQELLPMLQWILIMVLAGLFYAPVAQFLHQYANLDLILANVLGYFIVALVVHFIFLWIKNAIGEKLVGSDMFGRGEYYMGMTAGAIRFACMIVCLVALLNGHIISAEEMARTEKIQEKNFEGIRFPTYGGVQHAVLFESLSGKTVKGSFDRLLITSTSGGGSNSGNGKPGGDGSIAKKKEQELNDILGARK